MWKFLIGSVAAAAACAVAVNLPDIRRYLKIRAM
ncbi:MULTISPECIES: DUF6893 family small protein [Streptomyces]